MEPLQLSQYDRDLLERLTVALQPPAGPQEIVEEGVTSIELAASSTFNRSYTPDAGRVKWFRDELGQLWCKFTTASKSNGHVIPGTVRDHVWSADRVVQVQYDKERS